MNRKVIAGMTLAVFAGAAFAQNSGTTAPTTPALPTDPSSLPLPKDPLNPANTPANPGKLPTAGDTSSITNTLGSFGSADTNGDGRISRAEAKPNASLTSSFGKLDANGDGMLSQDEFKATGSVTATKSDGDKAKLTAGGKAFPKSLDINNDRKLSKDEVQKDSELFAQFETIDANGDGSISNQEYRLSTKDLNANKSGTDKSAKDKAQDKRDEVKDKLN